MQKELGQLTIAERKIKNDSEIICAPLRMGVGNQNAGKGHFTGYKHNFSTDVCEML